MHPPAPVSLFRSASPRSSHPNLILAGSTAAALFGLILAASPCAAAESPSGSIRYNRDIRPILAENCFACHGPDSASREADLRLDRFAEATAQREGSRPAFAPGNVDESEALARIRTSDPDLVMPPPKTKKSLTPEQIEILSRWVREGAQYEKHWSLIPPVKPAVPEIADPAFPLRSPIDHLILARLQQEGLTPAPEADRRTLARRVSLDLTGLPPKPEMVEAFVSDARPDAYEHYVDRLLESTAWGEHRGRYWLDAARYADTHGIHFDNYREMWSYRDWVIAAFNANTPWDEFTRISLAGDLLPNPSLDQLVGSGFNRCNITTNEGGIIDEEYLVLYTRDRTESTSQVWLGLTANCSVCHDHKFDELTQQEFYSLAAFFNNTTVGARDGNTKDPPPIIPVPLPEDRARWDALPAEIASAQALVDQRRRQSRPDFEAWLAQAAPESLATADPTDGLVLRAPLSEGAGRSLQIEAAGAARTVEVAESASWQQGGPGGHGLQPQGAAFELADVGDFDRSQPFSVAVWVKAPANDSQGAICARMDNEHDYRGWDLWVQGRRVGMHVVNTWPQDALKVVAKNQLPGNEWTHVAVSYDGSGTAAGVKVYYNGQLQETNVEQDTLRSTTRTEVPFKVGQRHTSEPFSGGVLQNLRVYSRLLGPGDVTSLARLALLQSLVAKPAEQRTDAERDELFSWWIESLDPSFQQAKGALAALEQERETLRGRGTVAHVMQERPESPTAFVLFRGEYDKRRDQVTPATPRALPAFPDDLPRNRLGFAEWLLREENPLPARVTVNRFWQEVFGTGIVKTAGDFGVSGELPSHPELLDWLAVDFREHGWDVKRFFKQVVTSSTYRQAATVTPEKLRRDPGNRLLSRGPRFRMDGEMIRDYALAVSGLLSPRIGGPSVKPYQPDGVWEAVAMNVSNTRAYQRDTGESLYRRSLYTFWKRSAPPAQMEIFNAPNRETCAVRRERTNTPLQALVTLNDEQFVEAARHLAQQLLVAEGDDAARLDVAARRILCRPLAPRELGILEGVHTRLLEHYQANVDAASALLKVGESPADASLDAAQLAAWTMTFNEMLNLDEALCK